MNCGGTQLKKCKLELKATIEALRTSDRETIDAVKRSMTKEYKLGFIEQITKNPLSSKQDYHFLSNWLPYTTYKYLEEVYPSEMRMAMYDSNTNNYPHVARTMKSILNMMESQLDREDLEIYQKRMIFCSILSYSLKYEYFINKFLENYKKKWKNSDFMKNLDDSTKTSIFTSVSNRRLHFHKNKKDYYDKTTETLYKTFSPESYEQEMKLIQRAQDRISKRKGLTADTKSF